MREGVAVSKPPAEDDDASNVVQFPARPVEYTGSAMALMHGLTLSVDKLRRALLKANTPQNRLQTLSLIDKITKTMLAIQEHMDVIDANADLIGSCIEPGQEAYFLSETSRSIFEVISLIQRRQTVLMVQKFSFRPSGGKLPVVNHDNNRPVLLEHEGRMACQWPRSSKQLSTKVPKRRKGR
jgi:hypothetical protein